MHVHIFTALDDGRLKGTFCLDNNLMMAYRLTIPKLAGSRLVQLLTFC